MLGFLRNSAVPECFLRHPSSYAAEGAVRIGVQPRCVAKRDLESNWVFCPDACDIFIGRKAAEVLQPATVIVGVDEDLEVLPELVMAVVV